MVKYRGKYILEGLDAIPEEMERDLDLAYGVCERLHNRFECEMCGKCCHQANINVRDEEVQRIADHLKISSDEFISEYLYRNNNLWLFKKSGACRFLDENNKCKIWQKRPMICGDFPYLVAKFMSRVYLSIVNEIPIDLAYMEDDWPCTAKIKDSVEALILEARKKKKIIRSL
ncbi:MAG: YkgJ family cysteine cluster protein [Methanomassiliicoccaceae archaeon]|nr:YkgJ family cysteine cluster protein [Methanomassiliicoccaceae archaeon]